MDDLKFKELFKALVDTEIKVNQLKREVEDVLRGYNNAYLSINWSAIKRDIRLNRTLRIDFPN